LIAQGKAEGRAVAEPVIALAIRAFDLRHAPLGVVLNAYTVLKNAQAKRQPQGRTRIARRQRRQVSSHNRSGETAHAQQYFGHVAIVAVDKPFGGAQGGQHVGFHFASKEELPVEPQKPRALPGKKNHASAHARNHAKALGQVASRQVKAQPKGDRDGSVFVERQRFLGEQAAGEARRQKGEKPS
jgi:hypothetical protein